MRFALVPFLALVACKGGKDDSDTDVIDCDAYTDTPLSNIAVPDWPAGLAEAVQAYEALEGTWTADACGTQITVVMRPIADSGDISVVEQGLPANAQCGCTHDPANPVDGAIGPIAYTTLDLSVANYPHEGFREENAGNVPGLPIAFFNDPDLRVRGCVNHLVPPVLLLDYTDNLITLRTGDSGVSGNVSLTGDGVAPETCTLTNWVRTGAAN